MSVWYAQAISLTSGLNSTNSRPLQSIVMMFLAFAGVCCSYDLGASTMFAECSLCLRVRSC